ncbi:lantibiotic dehydratase [Streptomyces olivaceoviridis]
MSATPVPAAADTAVPVPGSEWTLWPHVMVRSAGFPLDAVDLLADTTVATAADRVAAGLHGDPESDPAFRRAWEDHLRRRRTALADVLDDPWFQLAVSWQNRHVFDLALAPLRHKIDQEGARNSKWRQRERTLTRYWQRYCTKNESIGFFGPTGWARLRPGGPALDVTPGPGLVDRAEVFFESWVVDLLGRELEQEADLRPWLAPRRAPHIALAAEHVVLPGGRGRHRVDPLAMAALADADGRTPAAELIARLAARFGVGTDTVDAALRELQRRRWLIWRLDLSASVRPEAELAALLERADPDKRWKTTVVLDGLRTAQQELRDAWADGARVRAAMAALDETFTVATGHLAVRNEGQAYGGRTPTYLECGRDVAVDLGGELVAALAPLGPVLRSVRWLLAHIRQGLLGPVREAHRKLAATCGTPSATELWTACMPWLTGRLDALVADAVAELQRRWADLLDVPPDATRVTYRLADIEAGARERFPADEAGWTEARWCSPDVMIAAADQSAVRRGDFRLVLGEVHPAVNSLDFAWAHATRSRRDELIACLDADHPAGRLLVALPREARPRLTARSHPVLVRETDDVLVLMPNIPLPRRGRVHLGADVPVVADGDGLHLSVAGGRFDALDLFTGPLRAAVMQAFDMFPSDRPTPRVTIDRMVVARRRWTFAPDTLSFADVPGEAGRYVSVRAWRRDNGLPRHVFVKSPLEVKPFYVDFDSPPYVELLVQTVSAARRDGTGGHLVLSEMLPGPDETWLRDAAGHRYAAELRLVAHDTLATIPADGSPET